MSTKTITKTITHQQHSYISVFEPFYINGERRNRPLSIKGPIIVTSRGRVDAANPLSSLNINGGVRELRPLNTESGHLIASSLGGPNVSENIISMYAHINSGRWAEIERDVKNLLTQYKNTTVNIKIDLHYTDTIEPRVPTKLDVKLFVPPAPAPVYSAHCDHVRPTVACAISFNVDELYLLEQIEELLTNRSRHSFPWSLEDELIGKRLTLPHPSMVRPYEELDYLKTKRGYFPRTDFRNGKEFTEMQRQAILRTNQLRNSGYIKSDAPDDIKRPLLDVRGNTGAVIDHIEPRMVDGKICGCNAFSNARVISAEYNLYKNNKRPSYNLAPDIMSVPDHYSTEIPQEELLTSANGRISRRMNPRTERRYRR